MKVNNRDVVFLDIIPFHGGSKAANAVILSMLKDNGFRVTVICRDDTFWRTKGFKTKKIFELKLFEKYESGYGYFLKHGWIALSLARHLMRIKGNPVLMGGSGPGVDFGIYILKTFWEHEVVQLIHGPVALSRTIAKCLKLSALNFYVPGSRESIEQCRDQFRPHDSETLSLEQDRFYRLDNGLPSDNWPVKAKKNNGVRILWAASLLKWKGLELFTSAINRLESFSRIHVSICYIRPVSTNLGVSPIPKEASYLKIYESPNNLDEIRSQHNVFVSTSEREPFGLSILEAMAAGLCVVIPRDGAHWDRVLDHGINCIKYTPGSAKDLGEKLFQLYQGHQLIEKIGGEGSKVARMYRAEKTYLPCVQAVSHLLSDDYFRPSKNKVLKHG